MEENNRKERRKAKKQAKRNKVFEKMRSHVQSKYKKKVAEKEKKLGRPLTRAEKNKISNSIINGMGVQLVATSAAVVAAVSVGNKVLTQPALPAPEKTSTVETTTNDQTTAENVEIVKNDEQAEISEKMQDAEKFRKGLAVEKLENEEETLVKVPVTLEPEAEIDEIDSKEDVLNWLKDAYIDKYEEVTGKEDLSTSSIKIRNKKVPAMYKTSDGQYVTTIESPVATEKMLDEKGITYEEVTGGSVYMVSIANNGIIMDCANKEADGYHDVVVAEYYKEMQESKNSVLSELGDLTPKAFELYDYYGQLEEKGGHNEFIENIIKQTKESLKEKYRGVFENNTQDSQTQGGQSQDNKKQDEQKGFEPGD